MDIVEYSVNIEEKKDPILTIIGSLYIVYKLFAGWASLVWTSPGYIVIYKMCE